MTQMKYIKDGIYTISRVDVNETWLLNNLQDVHAAIRALELSARLKLVVLVNLKAILCIGVKVLVVGS